MSTIFAWPIFFHVQSLRYKSCMSSCLLPNLSFFSWRLWDWWTIPTSFTFMELLSSHLFSALWQVYMVTSVYTPSQTKFSAISLLHFVRIQSLSLSPTEIRFITSAYQTKMKKPNCVLVPRTHFFHLCYVSHFACKWIKLVERNDFTNDFTNVYMQQFDH